MVLKVATGFGMLREVGVMLQAVQYDNLSNLISDQLCQSAPSCYEAGFRSLYASSTRLETGEESQQVSLSRYILALTTTSCLIRFLRALVV